MSLQFVTFQDVDTGLGIAVRLTLRHGVFAGQNFGEWAGVLAAQAERGHQSFVMDEAREIRGFFGYALATEADARGWAYQGRRLSPAQCLAGDCLILNVWIATDDAAQRCMVQAMRQLGRDKRALYFRRYYSDGRVRSSHLAHPR